MALHTCPECQMLHDTGAAPSESPEVAIARINADRDLAVAKLQSRESRDIAETYAEADIAVAEAAAGAETDVAETEAEVAVDVAEAVAEAVTEEPEVAPVLDIEPVEEEPEDAPPAAEDTTPSAPRKARGLGMW